MKKAAQMHYITRNADQRFSRQIFRIESEIERRAYGGYDFLIIDVPASMLERISYHVREYGYIVTTENLSSIKIVWEAGIKFKKNKSEPKNQEK